jgi:chaperone modulatory protein CbpM
MIERREFLMRAQVEDGVLEAWVSEGWIAARAAEEGFSELDLARARLIAELRERLGVNDAGVGVALDLLDQVHGLRIVLRQITASFHALPEPTRQETLAKLRAAQGEG